MTTYNTGNPVPSADARDRFDNSQTLDEAVNGTLTFYQNRVGDNVLSLKGMADQFQADQAARSEAFQQFIDASGWSSLGAYAAGLTITSHSQTVDFEGQPYQLKPSIPVSLDDPYVTTGDWATESANFKLVGDNSLRQELASDDGGQLVSFLQSGDGAEPRSVEERLKDSVSVKDFGAVGDGVSDDSDAVQKAMLSTNKTIFFPSGRYRLTRTLYRVQGQLLGEGFQSALVFEGLNGADGIVFAPIAYQNTSGASNLSVLTKGSNGGRAFSTPYAAAQYNTLYSNWRWEHLNFAGATSLGDSHIYC